MPETVTNIYDGRAIVYFNSGRHTYSVRVPGVIEKLWQPSVTGILGVKSKEALVGWAAKQSLLYVERKLDKITHKGSINPSDMVSLLQEARDCWKDDDDATNIGTVVHRFLYNEMLYRCGKLPDRPVYPLRYDPVLAPDMTEELVKMANDSIKAGLSFFDENKFKPILMERVVWSPTHGAIGTPDFIGKINGKLAVADYKTSKRIFPEYWMQTAFYLNAFYEEFGEHPLDRYIINAKKDGGLDTEKRELDSFQDDFDGFLACNTLYRWDRENDEWKKGSAVQVLGPLDALVPKPSGAVTWPDMQYSNTQ